MAQLTYWQANTSYLASSYVLDGAGNIQFTTLGGMSASRPPAWTRTTTTDGTITWSFVGFGGRAIELQSLSPTVPGLVQESVDAVSYSRGILDAGKFVLLNTSGQLDPSMGGGGGGGSSFDKITSGDNTTATMTVDTGASLSYLNSGTINASEWAGTPITGSPTLGKIPIGQGSSAAWADPLVQGVYPPGTNVTTGNAGGPINPVLVGAQNPSSLLENLNVDASGNLYVTVANSTLAVTQSTSPWVVSDTTLEATAGTPGAAAPSKAIQIAGTDGTNLRALSTDTAGKLNVNATFSGSVTPALPPNVHTTGNITSTQSVILSLTGNGGGTLLFNITGSWTGTIVFEASIDGTNWVPAYASPFQYGTLSNAATANAQWLLNVGGMNAFRLRGNTVLTGTATCWLEVGAGSNAQVITDIIQGSISVNNFPAVQQVSGSVTSAQGAPNTVANSWPVEVTDGTNVLFTVAHPGEVTFTNASIGANVHDGGGTSILSTNDSGTVGLNVHLTNTGGISGTQYVEGTTAATPTGTVAMGKGSGNAIESLRLDASNNLYVDVNAPLPAGTNLLGQIEVYNGSVVVFSAAHPGITQDVSDGTPAATAPATAIQVGGVDSGGKLRALSTDASGVLNVNASVSGTFTPALTADRTATGTITAITNAVTLSTQGTASTVLNVVGTWAGTLSFQVSVDGTNWYPVTAYAKFPSGATTSTTTVNGQWQVPTGGVNSFRVIATAWTSGTATVWIEGGAGPLVVEVGQVTASNLNATATQGPAAALSAAWPVKVTDGTNVLGTPANPLDVNIQNTPTVTVGPGSNNIGYTSYELPTSSRMSRAAINFTASGDNTLVAGVAGQTVRVWRILFNVGASTAITIKDGASTALSGPLTFSTSGGIALDFSGDPWYVTSLGNGFVFNSSSAVQVGGTVWYTQS